MVIFGRGVAIGGDAGVTYPEQCVLLNNYLLVNENYYLFHLLYIYFIIFSYILLFPKIYLLICQ